MKVQSSNKTVDPKLTEKKISASQKSHRSELLICRKRWHSESFPTHIYLQNLASIQPRTSPPKFARPEVRKGSMAARVSPTPDAPSRRATAALPDTLEPSVGLRKGEKKSPRPGRTRSLSIRNPATPEKSSWSVCWELHFTTTIICVRQKSIFAPVGFSNRNNMTHAARPSSLPWHEDAKRKG